MCSYNALDIRSITDVNLDGDVPSTVWASVINIVKASMLPKLSFGEDRPPMKEDFSGFRTDIVHGMKAISGFLNRVVASDTIQNLDRESVVYILILCGEHSSSEVWTTDETRNLSNSCANALCNFYSCASVTDLLLGRAGRSFSPCLKQVLLLLRPKLMRDTWLQHPAAVSAYKWFLMQVHSPHLTEYLAVVSPTALLIVDDHDLERRLIGLSCISHIIDNVSRTDLCQQGLDEVFYKTLELMLLQRVADQIEPVIACMTSLLSKTERGYTRKAEPGMWDKFDSTLKTILQKMAFEDRIKVRLAYIKSLRPFISSMGPSIIRWSKPLLSVLDEYLSKESFDTRKYALEVLQQYVELSSPRVPMNGDFILFLLLRTLQDVSSEIVEEKHDLSELLRLIASCITNVKNLAPSEFASIYHDLLNIQCNEVMKSILMECVTEK